jgi:16S rRNA (guanine527-N7)-methyltransferase
MPTLSTERIGTLLEPFFPTPSFTLLTQLSVFLDLLLKWNARTNLTAIREPEEIVRRHFGESLFTALHLPSCRSLLDLGSGAGFPGLPIQLALPDLSVTLAESQNKKAAFLREAVRTLGLSTAVWANRVEALPEARRFDVVALRAVDNAGLALTLARARLNPGGVITHLTHLSEGQSKDALLLPGRDRVGLEFLR